ncbi:MAG TPA: hypothetical protein DCY86_05005 [Bdellovibrionales bacterium]|nr:hypothetical protein [Bdellovibrionales bacterium]
MQLDATKNKITYVSDHAILIKKMRLLRRLNRQQAALLFGFTFKNLEKMENGRSNISVERFQLFQEKYAFSEREVDELRSGKMPAPTDAHCIRKKITTEKREDRRFCHRKITRECKVLKEMRIIKNLGQHSASRLCGLGKDTIGFIENGRITLSDKKIRHIVEAYGLTMELFYQLLKVNPLRHEMVERSHDIINKMDENKLRAILPMLAQF